MKICRVRSTRASSWKKLQRKLVELHKEITQELWCLLTDINKEKEMKVFLGGLLTETEKVMLAKRIALATLLLRGWGWDDICKLLNVISATVNRM